LADVVNVVVNAVVEPASLPGATVRFTFDGVPALALVTVDAAGNP
jgi:hypothetical protein